MHSGLIATIFLGLNLLSNLLCGGSRPGRDVPRCQRSMLAEVIVEAVHFQHGNDLLAGSLYRPELPGRHLAVALVLGSGRQDRGYGGMGTTLGRYFARHGILCLTCIQEAMAFARLRMALIRGTGPYEALEQAQETVKTRDWFPVVHRCDRALFYAAQRMVNYDSEPSWEKVHCPVLAIYGDRDRSSGWPKPLVTRIRRGLKKAGNKDVTIRIFHDADHSLCRTGTKQAKEAGAHTDKGEHSDAPDFVSGYLNLMSDWLAKRFPVGAE